MYYLYSENRDADQIRSYCEADLRLCLRIMQIVGFLMRRLKKQSNLHRKIKHITFDQLIKLLILKVILSKP